MERDFWCLLSLATAALWARPFAHRVAAEVSQDELSPHGGGAGFWDWAFVILRFQRLYRGWGKTQAHLKRETRLILRTAGALRPGRVVVELGSGAGLLREWLPGPYRRGWTEVDIDFVALRLGSIERPGVPRVCADGGNLPFGSAASTSSWG